MSLFIYAVGLSLMEIIAKIISPFNRKANSFTSGRKMALPYLKKELATNNSKLLWVHASSVGEFEQGKPVMELFKSKNPDYKILVSFYSPSGYEAVKIDELVDFKCYLPKDSRVNAKEFIKLANPDLAIFIKYEFWHFYLAELSKNEIPIFSVSSIFRPTQAFFKWYGKFFRNMLENFNHFFVQDEESQNLLESINIKSTISGDTRLDRVLDIRNANQNFSEIEHFVSDKPTFIIGSMRKEDIGFIIEFIRRTPDYKFIIAPHEISEQTINPLEAQFKCLRYSKISNAEITADILIIDSIGILSRIYRYGQFAYIGGGFSDGIHNILEPAVFRIPVFFGNLDYTRFKEAMDLSLLGAAFPVGSVNEMVEIHQSINQDENRLKDIQDAIDSYIKLNKGASQRIINSLNSFA